MATQSWYMRLEDEVLALSKRMDELADVIDGEVEANSDTNKLNPENYNVQSTLQTNLNELAKKIQTVSWLLEANKNDSLYNLSARARNT